MSQRAALPGSGSPGGNGRATRRRIGTGKLIGITVTVAALLMVGLTTHALVARASCTNSPALVNVAASADIAAAVQTVARSFNDTRHVADGRCVEVQVTAGDPATQTAQIDGQGVLQGAPIDAWIPDSTLWVDTARALALGAQQVQPTGQSVARSPLMLVTSKTVADSTHIFDAQPGWKVLLPPGYGGPPASLNLDVDLPDPASSAAGLAALIEVNRAIGSGPDARAALTKFALQVTPRPDFDAPQALAQLAGAFALEPWVTVASEQAVLAYDRASPKAPLAARYPIGANAALGSPELDYPYVLTTLNSVQIQAARLFGDYLQSGYAQSVVRYDGFRSASGEPDNMPASAELATQPLQLAAAAAPQTAAADLQDWQRLALGYRDLVLADVSPATDQRTGAGTQTTFQVATATAAKGLGLFPPTAQMGLWEMGAAGESAASPYRELVPIGPLDGPLGVLTRENQIEQIISTLRPQANGVLALNSAILAAYKYMTAHYTPGYANGLILLTSGIDNAMGDISDSQLLTQLERLYNPSKKIDITTIVFSTRGDFKGLAADARATGGSAFQVTNPDQVGAVFIEATSQRICNQGC